MPNQSIIETRHNQMFPILEASEIERVRRFGSVHCFSSGEALQKVGVVGCGRSIILAGRIEAIRYNAAGQQEPIITQGPGAFLGELAQLAGRPALVDAYARESVKVLIIPPDQLRALLIADAELGERIMRALILRRVGLIETGAGGPVIVGRADNSDVLRLENFLRRNSHPRQMLDPDTDSEATALIERFHVDLASCQSFFVRWGSCCAIPARTNLRVALAWWVRSIRIAFMTQPLSGLDLRALPQRFTPDQRGFRFSSLITAPEVAKPALRQGLRITSAFLRASAAMP